VSSSLGLKRNVKVISGFRGICRRLGNLFLVRQQRLGFLQPRRQATILLLDEDMIPVPALIASAVLRWLVYTEIGAGWIEARKKEIPIQHGRRTGTIGCVENVARHRKKD
jgi:hypothetical protein